MKLDPAKTALLIINMNNDLMGWEGVRPLVPRLGSLLQRARQARVTVIFSSLAFCAGGTDSGQLGKFWPSIGKGEILTKGTPGSEIVNELTPLPGEHVLERNRYSAFFGSELEAILKEKRVETLIIGGYSTNFCCDSTARDANFRDFKVIVLEDGTAPIALADSAGGEISGRQVQETTLANLRQGFAQTAPVQVVIEALSA